jgi:hypothetical protein
MDGWMDVWIDGLRDDRATDVERRRELFMGGESMPRSGGGKKR